MALTAAERKRHEEARKRAAKQDALAAEAKRKQAALNKDQKAKKDKIVSDLRGREDKVRTTANTKSQAAEIEQARRRGEVADIHGGGKAAKAKMEAEIAAIKKKYAAGVTPAAKPAAKPTSRFAGAREANLTRINNDPRFAAPPVAAPQPLRSPAIGAPVHASPAAFGSAPQLTQSPYVGSSAASPARPSTPGQAVQQQPNPYAGIGDIRGQQIPQAPVQQDAQMSVGKQEYGGQKLQGVDDNGIDMERRRAFLDADNSLAGLKAVKELLNRRKLSISVES